MAVGSRVSSVNTRRGAASPQVGASATRTPTRNATPPRNPQRPSQDSSSSTTRVTTPPPRAGATTVRSGAVSSSSRAGATTVRAGAVSSSSRAGATNTARAGASSPSSRAGATNTARAGASSPSSRVANTNIVRAAGASLPPSRPDVTRAGAGVRNTAVSTPREANAFGANNKDFSSSIANRIQSASKFMDETWEEKKAKAKGEKERLSVTNNFRLGGASGFPSTFTKFPSLNDNPSDISFDLGGKKRKFFGFRLLKILFVVIVVVFAILFILFSKYKISGHSLTSKNINGIEDANALISKEKRVSVITVKKSKINTSFDAFGRVALYKALDLSFNEQGIITHLKAVEGKWYKKGTVLAKLDTKSANFDVSIKKHTYLGEKKNFVRTVDLYRKGATSKAYYDKVAASYESSKASYYQSLDHLKNMYIKAPFSGMVSKRYKEKSEQVLEGDKVIRFYSPELLQIDVVLTSKIAKTILEQGKNNFVYKIYSEDNPNKKYPVKLKEISHVDNENKVVSSYLFKFTISKKSAKGLIAGASVKLDIVAKKAKNKLYIPMDSVLSDAEGRMYVWLVKDEITLKKYVKTGEINNDKVEIVKGIEEGDVIVTAGMGSLFDKQKVSIIY